ncbi:MAG: Ig-like domain-containing protein, partial [Oscillospiraceae bacterium]
MKKKAALVLVLAACLLLSACVSVTEISLPRSISIEAGETAAVELTAKYNKENVSDEDAAKALAALVWASSDEAIATVESGTVTAVSAGKAQVTASDKSGKATATIEVVVTVPPQSIEAENLELQLGGVETAALEVTASPANATQTGFKYSSSDERVATVDEKGNVTAKALGECEITVTTKNNKTATATVTVKQAPTGIALDSNEGWIYVGVSIMLEPYTTPEGAAPSTYTFASSNGG